MIGQEQIQTVIYTSVKSIKLFNLYFQHKHDQVGIMRNEFYLSGFYQLCKNWQITLELTIKFVSDSLTFTHR